LPNL